jgi:hypothetical protein
MTSLLTTVFSVFAYILIGFVIKKINIIPDQFSKIYNYVSFNALLPLALITNFWTVTFPELIVHQLILAFFGAGIIIFLIGFFFSKKLLNFKTDDCALFGLSACFGNSVAFGIPLMYSILGPIEAMPYMILVLFHGLIHFTYTTIIIEGYRNRSYSIYKMLVKTIMGLAKNIVLFAMFIGIALNYSQIPFPASLEIILTPITNIALPAVLISLGFALAEFKIINETSHSLVLTTLKNFVHPLIAFVIAKYIFSMPHLLIFIVTMAAALPSGSQTYYFSYRYNSLQKIISANIVLSTFVSFFTLSFLIIIFDY